MFSAFEGSLRSLLDSFLLETVCSYCYSEFECSCVRISARACCFSFVHCAGRIHGLSSSATEHFTLLACVHWLQHVGGRYSRFQCFADSPKATRLKLTASCCICTFVLWCDLTPSLLSITIPCYLLHLLYLGWDITGFIVGCHSYAKNIKEKDWGIYCIYPS